MQPGLRLRLAREKLGLTYRDVERASYELAALRGRPDFILHISRLADIENRGVVPGLHKLYTLATPWTKSMPPTVFAKTYWDMSPQINERLRRLNEKLDRFWKPEVTQK